MKTLNYIFFMALFFWAMQTKAQETQKNDSTTKTRQFQFCFVSPVSTNGTEATEYTNNFSVNMLVGVNGGVDGIEVGGFTNIIKHNMQGAQFAGFANITAGNTRGVASAGFLNLTRGKVTGAQFAGFSNLVLENSEGAQVSGFVNLARKNLIGIQSAGYFNYAGGRMKGLQLSGFLNFAKKLDGVQVAPFNYVDSLEHGVPIGVFSIVRKGGYFALEIGGNESFYGNAAFKMGVKHFYNILAVGATPKDDQILWGWGYGVGSLIDLSKKTALNLDLMCYHVNEDEWFSDHLNLLHKVNLMVSYKIGNKIRFFGGPSFNVMISESKDNAGVSRSTPIVPSSTFFDKTYDETHVQMYAGFKIGVRI